MQVTGSNRDKNRSTRLSIRIPNGQSLHRDTLSVDEEVKNIDLTIEGTGVLSFPAELSEGLVFESMFAIVGVILSEDEKIAMANTEGTIGFALRLSAEVTEQISEWRARGLEVSLHTPLEGVVVRAIVGSRRPKTAVLRIEEGVVYVAISVERKICFAEALPISGEEQVVNLLAHLNQDFELVKAHFVLLGESSEQYYKTIKKYFRRVRCEK